jgi:hypothetical protein
MCIEIPQKTGSELLLAFGRRTTDCRNAGNADGVVIQDFPLEYCCGEIIYQLCRVSQ